MTLPAEDVSEDECTDCPLAGRRRFLRDAAALVAGAVLALGGTAARASAMTLRPMSATSRSDDERTYPMPAADGATIDRDAEVILMRYQNRVYAFSLSCPHQHTALRWLADEGRFQCPKHKSRYQPDGIFISGRATRSMDRFALRAAGSSVIVDVSALYREDRDAGPWKAAVLTV